MKIEKLSKKNRPEPKLWNEKKEAPRGSILQNVLSSITPHEKNQGEA